MCSFKKLSWLIYLVSLLCVLSCVRKHDQDTIFSGEISWRETIVAGSTDAYMEVRHIVLKGSNYAIGKKIAEIALEHNIQLNPRGDPVRNKVQRAYMEKNYPIYSERMKGIADGFGVSFDNNEYDLSFLSQYPSSRPGCSVVFYPGTFTENGHGVLSRNYDFTTGTFQGRRPQEDEMAVMSRPYIFEMYPDQGYASLSLCAFDLLGGVLDGINSEGLAVAILADDETLLHYDREPFTGVGLHELMCMRYILDTCKDVGEAKEALFYAKHYYSFIPCHYMIADKNGDSFVFEFSSIRNAAHCVDGQGPQWVTNHLLSKYPSMDQFPEESMIDSFERYRTLHDAIHGRSRFSLGDMKAINAAVASTDMDSQNPEYAPHRTLWHSLYDLQKRRLQAKFYLGESAEGIQYSEYINLQLESE